MKPQELALLAVLATAVAPIAGAQTQDWILQLGSLESDGVSTAAPDGSGGFYVSGGTTGSLGGPHAGSGDAWIARYDGAGSQTWIQQLGTSTNDSAETVVPDGVGGVFVTGFTSAGLGGTHAGLLDGCDLALGENLLPVIDSSRHGGRADHGVLLRGVFVHDEILTGEHLGFVGKVKKPADLRCSFLGIGHEFFIADAEDLFREFGFGCQAEGNVAEPPVDAVDDVIGSPVQAEDR